jgi:hypothetical protein
MPFNLTTFDAALQAKLNTASVNLSAQDYLLLTKAVAAAIEVSEGVSLLSLKGTANGVAGLDGSANVPISQLLNAIPSQGGNSGKFLTTNGTATSWGTPDPFPSQTGNNNKILKTNGTTVSWTDVISMNDVEITDQLNVGSLSAGLRTTDAYTNPMAVFSTNQPDYAQLVIKNTNSGSAASSDYIAYTDDGDDTSGWIDMGITSSTFADPNFTITGAHDGYIFMEAPVEATGKGNLVLATGGNGTQNKIIFAAGGLQSDNTQMTITPDQNVHIEIDTPSTSASTGALTVVGGVGIQGDMNVNGDVSIQGTITFGGGGTTVETSNLAVTDPAVFVGTNNQADIVDLAFIGEYATSVSAITRTITNKALTNNVATLTTGSAHTYLAGDIVTITGVDATFNGTFNIIDVPTTTTFTYAKTATNVTSVAVSPAGSASVTARRKFAGIARDASDGIVKVFKDATSKPTSTINFSEAGLGYASIKVGGAEIGSVTNTEIGYLSGVTSSIQTQLGTKANLSGGATFTGTISLPSTTSIGNVDSTEIGYLDGVTSAIQTQLNNKAPLSSPTFTGTVTVPSTISVTGGGTLTLPSSTGTLITSADASSTYTPLLQSTTTPTFTSNAYTLQSTDKDKLVLASNGSTAGTITIPTGVFSQGSVITIVQTGSGQLTLATSGTLNSYLNQTKFSGQYASVQIICTATNTFLAVGNLTA